MLIEFFLRLRLFKYNLLDYKVVTEEKYTDLNGPLLTYTTFSKENCVTSCNDMSGELLDTTYLKDLTKGGFYEKWYRYLHYENVYHLITVLIIVSYSMINSIKNNIGISDKLIHNHNITRSEDTNELLQRIAYRTIKADISIEFHVDVRFDFKNKKWFNGKSKTEIDKTQWQSHIEELKSHPTYPELRDITYYIITDHELHQYRMNQTINKKYLFTRG